MNQVIYIDTETFNHTDINDVGGYRYTDSAELLSLHWGQDGELLPRWEPDLSPELPARLIEIANDPNIQLKAHNANFDRRVINKVLREHGQPEIPIDRWSCTMAYVNRRSAEDQRRQTPDP
jgi:hypothetical protein